MTTTEITASTDRVSLPELLADLVLLQTRGDLPEPVSVTARAHISQAIVELSTRPHLDAWRAVLGGQGVTEVPLHSGAMLHTNLYGADRRGWTVCLTATVPVPLSAEVIEQLAEVAK